MSEFDPRNENNQNSGENQPQSGGENMQPPGGGDANQAQTAAPGPLQIGESLNEAFQIVTNNAVPFILGFGLMWVIMVGAALIIPGGTFISWIIGGHVAAGLFLMTRKARRGGTVEFKDIFTGFENFVNIMVGYLIFAVLTTIAAIFCFIPGLIVGALLMFLLPSIALDHLSIDRAISRAWESSTGDFLNHFLFYIVLALLFFAGVLLCGVGTIFTAPLACVMIAIAYDNKFNPVSQAASNEPAINDEQPQ